MSNNIDADRKLLLELAAKVNSRDTREYASANGWRRKPQDYGRLAIFDHTTLELTQLLIPLDAEAEEYPKLILQVAMDIAEVEKRSAIAVLNDLLNPSADIVRYRISDPTISSDLLLLRGIEVLEGAKRSLLAAAHTILSPLPYHPRLSRSEAKAFVDQCRLKQTEYGSFVVAIACPLNAVDSDGLLPGIDSFTRATTKVLMKSLKRIESCIDADDQESLTNFGSDETPISANLCEALTRMEPPGPQGFLEVSTTWASTHPNAEAPGRYSVQFPHDYFEVIRNIGFLLRPGHEFRNASFVGQVETLNGDLNTDGKRHGEVLVDLLLDNELIQTRMTLTPEQYAIADDAHMKGVPVIVKGELYRGRRIHKVINITDFKSIPSDDESKVVLR